MQERRYVTTATQCQVDIRMLRAEEGRLLIKTSLTGVMQLSPDVGMKPCALYSKKVEDYIRHDPWVPS